MNAHRDPDRLINAFLMEGQTELADQVYDAVRATVEHKRQRVVIGPWRMPTMNKFVSLGLGAAVVVVALIIGSQLLGPPAPTGVGGAPTAKPAPSPTEAPSASAAGIPKGPHTVIDEGAIADAPQITVTIAAPGWVALPDFGGLIKGDDGQDPPKTVSAAMLAWSWPAGTGFYVYGDPCQWRSTAPDTPATTVDEIVAALTAQASRDASDPVDVTVAGHTGKQITLHVPNDAPTRAEAFKDCDDDTFASYGTDPAVPNRHHQGPGQVDELWILDVVGSIVILDAMYGPAVPADFVDEMRALAESATFE